MQDLRLISHLETTGAEEIVVGKVEAETTVEIDVHITATMMMILLSVSCMRSLAILLITVFIVLISLLSHLVAGRRMVGGKGISHFDFDNAYRATPETVKDDLWYLDSKATSHVTKDLCKLEDTAKPSGKMNIIVGDNYKLGVERVGSSTVQNVPNKKVKLSNVLYTPKIKKNLLSVHKVAYDNDADVIFNSNGVCVKD